MVDEKNFSDWLYETKKKSGVFCACFCVEENFEV